MNRLLTTLLVWLLMATLPLHAVAASVKPSCAPVQHQTGAPPVHAHAALSAADNAHAHHDEHAGHAGHAAPGSEMADTTETADSANAHASDVPHSSCSACSVFCVGAVAPPSALLSVPSAGGSESAVGTPADLLTGFIPDGPQRPPRP